MQTLPSSELIWAFTGVAFLSTAFSAAALPSALAPECSAGFYSGLEYEPDQRHAEIVILDLGLESAKVKKFSTPGAKGDLNNASTAEGVPCVETSEESESLGAAASTSYRAIIARLNYFAQDRVVIR